VVLAVGACSSDSAILPTGSLFGPPKAPKPKTPTEQVSERAFRAGTTTAKAKRCGYVFDPAAIRQSYLAYEGAQGNPPALMALAEKKYDHTVQAVTTLVASEASFCSDEETAAIKSGLGKALAGDFALPAQKLDVSPFSSKAEPMDREKIFKPIR
jgi:hypothetical protein